MWLSRRDAGAEPGWDKDGRIGDNAASSMCGDRSSAVPHFATQRLNELGPSPLAKKIFNGDGLIVPYLRNDRRTKEMAMSATAIASYPRS
jgi:hypothetical protein